MAWTCCRSIELKHAMLPFSKHYVITHAGPTTSYVHSPPPCTLHSNVRLAMWATLLLGASLVLTELAPPV